LQKKKLLIPKAKDKLEVAICHLQYREVIFKITNCDLKSGDIMVENSVVTIEQIIGKIYHIRGVKVILDRDLSGLYEVETRILKRNVRRHIDRFPDDFMFELTKEEYKQKKSITT